MNHAEHFLSRLERLDTREVDLALELYRSPELLRHVLASVRLPEAADRVAISLDDPVLGPFLIVTRDGHFVTCLGRDMRAGDRFVVTRGQLDALSEKFEALRERMALARQLTKGSERPLAHLLRRLFASADAVCREEWLAVSAWEPMLQPIALDLYLAMATEILEQGPILRRLRSDKGPAAEALHRYWNVLHAASHLLLLATMGGNSEHYLARTADVPAARSTLSFALTMTGMTSLIARGAWAVGRLGKPLLPAYKGAIVTDVALFELLDSLFALLAIGRRTSDTRAEIGKALRAAPQVARTPQAEKVRQHHGREVATLCEVVTETLDVEDQHMEESLLRLGRHLLGEPSPSPDVEELPADVLRSFPLVHHSDGLSDGRKVLHSLMLVAATARGAPDQFYLPQTYQRAMHRPWEPSFTLRLLAPMARVEKAQRRPAVRAAAPGPNQPCTCGSGRKYKKCCGR